MKRAPLPCSSRPPSRDKPWEKCSGVCVGGRRAEPNSAPGLRRVRQVSFLFLFPVMTCFSFFLFFFFFLSRPFLCALEQVKEVFKRRCHLGQQVEQSTEGAVLWNMSPGKLVCLYWLVRPASHLANTISPCDTGTGGLTLPLKICEKWWEFEKALLLLLKVL